MTLRSLPKVARSGRPEFRREIGLLALTFISLGSIIGSGWLLGALTAASSAGGTSIVSWLLAGAIIVLLALVHSELRAAYPLAGARGAGHGWRSGRWAVSRPAGWPGFRL